MHDADKSASADLAVPARPAAPVPPPTPRFNWVAGVPIPTAAQRRWMQLRADAAREGKRFDIPPPEFE